MRWPGRRNRGIPDPVTSAIKRCHSGHLHSSSVPLAFSGKKLYVIRVTQTIFRRRSRIGTHRPERRWQPTTARAPTPGPFALPGNARIYNDRAINPVIKAYSQTYSFLRQENAIESGGTGRGKGAESQASEGQNGGPYGGAKVGDLVQWESQGTLQFPKPLRVRMVSDDGQWLAVEGSQTGIPMNEVIVESASQEGNGHRKPPIFPIEQGNGVPMEKDEVEWMRNRLGHDTNVRLLVKGDMGPREIGKLIKLLKAQKAVLEDDDGDEDIDPDEQMKRDYP